MISLKVSKGPSLGTNFTLVCPYTLLAHYGELSWAASFGVNVGIVRISVGLEDINELEGKFDEAFLMTANETNSMPRSDGDSVGSNSNRSSPISNKMNESSNSNSNSSDSKGEIDAGTSHIQTNDKNVENEIKQSDNQTIPVDSPTTSSISNVSDIPSPTVPSDYYYYYYYFYYYYYYLLLL